MTGKSRRILLSATTLLVVVLGACGALIWGQLDQEEPVPSEARRQFVGSMEVVKEISTSNPAGADGYEIQYLVVRPERSSSFPGQYLKGLGEKGWKSEPKDGTSGGHEMWRTDPDVLASVRLLSGYLQDHSDGDPQNDGVVEELERDIPDPEGLLLITVQPSG